MFDNHTFEKCTGTLKQIRRQLKSLFKRDPYGLWGKLNTVEYFENFEHHCEKCGDRAFHKFLVDSATDLKPLDKLIKEEEP